MHETRRAGARTAAFGDDARDVVAQRGFHHGRADFGVDRVLRAVVLDEGDLGIYATPSFFCRLVDDVVYWNTSRFSG